MHLEIAYIYIIYMIRSGIWVDRLRAHTHILHANVFAFATSLPVTMDLIIV